jgi:hypothetical protein
MGRPGVNSGAAAPAAFTTAPASIGPPPVSTRRAHADRLDAGPQHGSARHRPVEQPPRCVDRIDHAIARDAQRAGEAGPQVRLGARELFGRELLHRDAAAAVEARLVGDVRQLLGGGGDPERPRRIVLAGGRHRVGKAGPQPPRPLGQRELRGRVVHDDDVAHRGRRRAAAGEPRFEHRHGKPGLRQRVRARRPDDAGADDETSGDGMALRRARAGTGRAVEVGVVLPVMNARPGSAE